MNTGKKIKKKAKPRKVKKKKINNEIVVNERVLNTFQRVVYARLVMEDAKLSIEDVLNEIRDLEFSIKQDIYEEAK